MRVALHNDAVADSLEACGFQIRRSQIIWAKDRFALGRGHYHWQHEPCWYAVRGRRALARRSQADHGVADREPREDAEHGHGTQKPVECMRRPIENNSSPGQAVYEPFCGSGTTIIAAEMTGRACHAIELNPVYVDVAVRRWQAFTGKTAVAGGERRSFAEVAEQRGVDLRDGAAWRSAAGSLSRSRPRSRPAIRASDALTHAGAGAGSGRHALPASGAAERARARRIGRCIWPTRRRAICRRSTRRCWRGSAWPRPMPTRRNEKIEELGLLVKAPNTGLPIQSPYLPVLNRQTEIARKLAAELALPPAQRNRVGPYGPEHDGPSPWDALEG